MVLPGAEANPIVGRMQTGHLKTCLNDNATISPATPFRSRPSAALRLRQTIPGTDDSC